MSSRKHAILLSLLMPRTVFWLSLDQFISLDGSESPGDFQEAISYPFRGKFMLSGYRSSLYDRAAEANGWTRHDFDIANHAAGGEEKRRMVECLWCNFPGKES